MNTIQKSLYVMTFLSFASSSHAAEKAKTNESQASDTVVIDYGRPPIVQIKTAIMTPEKLYLLETFLDKGYPSAAYDTRRALPLILKTPQQKQQYFGDTGTGISMIYNSPWVRARHLRDLSRALNGYALKSYQGRKKSGWYEWKPPFDPKDLEDSFLEDGKQTLLTSIEVLKVPLKLPPPRYIVESNVKMPGVTRYIYTTYPLASLYSMCKAIDGFGATNPTLALPVKVRLKNIRQIQRNYAIEHLKLLRSKSWSETRENAQTLAFAKSYQQQNQLLLRQLDSLKADITKMFNELKKSAKAPTN